MKMYKVEKGDPIIVKVIRYLNDLSKITTPEEISNKITNDVALDPSNIYAHYIGALEYVPDSFITTYLKATAPDLLKKEAYSILLKLYAENVIPYGEEPVLLKKFDDIRIQLTEEDVLHHMSIGSMYIDHDAGTSYIETYVAPYMKKNIPYRINFTGFSVGAITGYLVHVVEKYLIRILTVSKPLCMIHANSPEIFTTNEAEYYMHNIEEIISLVSQYIQHDWLRSLSRAHFIPKLCAALFGMVATPNNIVCTMSNSILDTLRNYKCSHLIPTDIVCNILHSATICTLDISDSNIHHLVENIKKVEGEYRLCETMSDVMTQNSNMFATVNAQRYMLIADSMVVENRLVLLKVSKEVKNKDIAKLIKQSVNGEYGSKVVKEKSSKKDKKNKKKDKIKKKDKKKNKKKKEK